MITSGIMMNIKNTFMTNIDSCKVICFPKVTDRSGNITILENYSEDLPFVVKRIFYLYDIPGGESRGAHAHKMCHQLLFAASGSFEVQLNDGIRQKTVFLNQSNNGLHIPPGIWASEVNFSSGSICLVLASLEYSESDYIRDYNEFLKYISNEKN